MPEPALARSGSTTRSSRRRSPVRPLASPAAPLLAALSELSRARPVVVVIFGDHGEEFLEHGHFGHTSNFAPEQVRVLPVSEKAAEYAKGVEARLRAAGLRVTADLGSDKIGARIRTATLDKVPYMAVVGEKEAQSGGVAVRDRVTGDLGTMPVDDFIARMASEVRDRRLPNG